MAERLYRIRKAAELSGVSEALIRAWERRYGLLKPRRTASGYRAYTEADIEILRRMKGLTADGVAIGEAIRLLPEVRRQVQAQERGHAAGGEPIAQLEAWSARILEAAARFDQAGVHAVLDEALSALPPVRVFEQLLGPLLREVGERWHQGKASVGEEHLVSQAVRARLLSLIHGAPQSSRRHAVCACLPDEDHELGLLGAALRLRHLGYRVTYLGPRTPLDQLIQVCRALEPDLVALSAVNDEGKKPLVAPVTKLRERLPPSTGLLLGGAAAQRYADACTAAGAKVILTEEDWHRLAGLR